MKIFNNKLTVTLDETTVEFDGWTISLSDDEATIQEQANFLGLTMEQVKSLPKTFELTVEGRGFSAWISVNQGTQNVYSHETFNYASFFKYPPYKHGDNEKAYEAIKNALLAVDFASMQKGNFIEGLS